MDGYMHKIKREKDTKFRGKDCKRPSGEKTLHMEN